MFTWLALNTLCALPLALVALLARRLPRVSPGAEHLLWLLVLVRLVLPPLPSVAPAPASGPSTPAVISSEIGLGDQLVARATRMFGTNWSVWAERILLGLFLATLAYVVLRELVRVRAVERCVRRVAAPLADGPLVGHVRRVAAALGVSAPRVRVLPEASGPFLWSLRRPVLVLPGSDPLPAPTVIAHELAHLRRRDHWTAWLELLVQGFHFWNPLFWLARRELHRAAELACDQWVVERFPAERRAFAEALIETAERASRGGFVPRAAQAIGMDRRDFEERLVRILRGGRAGGVQRGLLAAGMLCTALTLPGLAAPTLREFRASLPELPAGRDLETWRKTLAEAEKRLAKDPKDGQGTMQRGVALLGLGRPEEALEAFALQEQLGYQPGKALYNRACAEAKLGRIEDALVSLMRAADLGIDVAQFAAEDEDLAPLREHPDFALAFGP